MKLDLLKPGAHLIVRNGARGEQVAVVASVSRDDGFSLRAHKWLMRGERWTGRVRIWHSEVLRYATAEDFKKRRVRSMAPIGN